MSDKDKKLSSLKQTMEKLSRVKTQQLAQKKMLEEKAKDLALREKEVSERENEMRNEIAILLDQNDALEKEKQVEAEQHMKLISDLSNENKRLSSLVSTPIDSTDDELTRLRLMTSSLNQQIVDDANKLKKHEKKMKQLIQENTRLKQKSTEDDLSSSIQQELEIKTRQVTELEEKMVALLGQQSNGGISVNSTLSEQSDETIHELKEENRVLTIALDEAKQLAVKAQKEATTATSRLETLRSQLEDAESDIAELEKSNEDKDEEMDRMQENFKKQFREMKKAAAKDMKELTAELEEARPTTAASVTESNAVVIDNDEVSLKDKLESEIKERLESLLNEEQTRVKAYEEEIERLRNTQQGFVNTEEANSSFISELEDELAQNKGELASLKVENELLKEQTVSLRKELDTSLSESSSLRESLDEIRSDQASSDKIRLLDEHSRDIAQQRDNLQTQYNDLKIEFDQLSIESKKEEEKYIEERKEITDKMNKVIAEKEEIEEKLNVTLKTLEEAQSESAHQADIEVKKKKNTANDIKKFKQIIKKLKEELISENNKAKELKEQFEQEKEKNINEMNELKRQLEISASREEFDIAVKNNHIQSEKISELEEKLEIKINELKESETKIQEKSQGLTETDGKYENLNKKTGKLVKQMKQLRNMLEISKKKEIEAEERISILTAEKQAALDKANKKETELLTLEKSFQDDTKVKSDSENSEIEKLKVKYDNKNTEFIDLSRTLNEEISELKLLYSNVQEELSEEKRQHNFAKEDCEKLNIQINELHIRFDELQQTHNTLENDYQKLEMSGSKMEDFENTNKALHENIQKYQVNIQDLESKVSELNMNMNILENAKKQLEERDEMLTNELEELKLQSQENNNKMKEAENNVNILTESLSNMTHERNALAQVNQQIEEQINNKNEDCVRLEEQIIQFQEEKKQSESKIIQLWEEKTKKLETDNASLQKNHKAVMEKLHMAAKKLKQDKKDKANYTSQIRNLEGKLKEEKNKLDIMSKELQEVPSSESLHNECMSALEEANIEKQRVISFMEEDFTAQIDALKESLTEKQSQIDELESTQSQLNSQLSNMSVQISTYQDEITSLKNNISKYEEELMTIKTENENNENNNNEMNEQQLQEITRLTTELETAQNTLAEYTHKMISLEEIIQEKDNNIEIKQKELQDMEQKIKDVEMESLDNSQLLLEEDEKEKSSKLEELKEQINAQDIEIASLKENIERLKEEKATVEAAAANVVQETETISTTAAATVTAKDKTTTDWQRYFFILLVRIIELRMSATGIIIMQSFGWIKEKDGSEMWVSFGKKFGIDKLSSNSKNCMNKMLNYLQQKNPKAIINQSFIKNILDTSFQSSWTSEQIINSKAPITPSSPSKKFNFDNNQNQNNSSMNDLEEKCTHLQEQLTAAFNFEGELKKTIEIMTNSITEKEKNIDELQIQCSELEEKVSAAFEAQQALNLDNEETLRENRKLKNEIDEMSENMSDVSKTETDELKNQLSILEKQIKQEQEQLEEQISIHNREKKELHEQLENIKNNQDNMIKQLSEKEEELEVLRNTKQDEEIISQLEIQLRERTDEIQSIGTQLQDAMMLIQVNQADTEVYEKGIKERDTFIQMQKKKLVVLEEEKKAELERKERDRIALAEKKKEEEERLAAEEAKAEEEKTFWQKWTQKKKGPTQAILTDNAMYYDEATGKYHFPGNEDDDTEDAGPALPPARVILPTEPSPIVLPSKSGKQITLSKNFILSKLNNSSSIASGTTKSVPVTNNATILPPVMSAIDNQQSKTAAKKSEKSEKRKKATGWAAKAKKKTDKKTKETTELPGPSLFGLPPVPTGVNNAFASKKRGLSSRYITSDPDMVADDNNETNNNDVMSMLSAPLPGSDDTMMTPWAPIPVMNSTSSFIPESTASSSHIEESLQMNNEQDEQQSNLEVSSSLSSSDNNNHQELVAELNRVKEELRQYRQVKEEQVRLNGKTIEEWESYANEQESTIEELKQQQQVEQQESTMELPVEDGGENGQLLSTIRQLRQSLKKEKKLLMKANQKIKELEKELSKNNKLSSSSSNNNDNSSILQKELLDLKMTRQKEHNEFNAQISSLQAQLQNMVMHKEEQSSNNGSLNNDSNNREREKLISQLNSIRAEMKMLKQSNASASSPPVSTVDMTSVKQRLHAFEKGQSRSTASAIAYLLFLTLIASVSSATMYSNTLSPS